MNQTFDLNRFANLFIKHTADNYKTYLMSLGVLIGVLFFSLGFLRYVNHGSIAINNQIPFFVFFLMMGGSIFTSIIFSDLGKKKKAIAALMLPASHFEKFLIGWTWSYIIFQLLFIPVFYISVIVINQIFHHDASDKPELMSLFSADQKNYIFLVFFAVLHAIVLLASIYFETYHFIKAAFAFFISYFLLIYLNFKFLQLVITQYIESAIPFTNVNVNENGTYFHLRMPDDEMKYTLIIFLVFAVILWVGSFYRLKEKEV